MILFFRQEFHLCVDLNLTVKSAGLEEEDELHSLRKLKIIFICHVTCNDWLVQMYPNYILLIDALLCCI